MAERSETVAPSLVGKVGQASLHPAIEVPGATSLGAAARRMKDDDARCLLVRAADGRLGLLTGTDLRDAALIDGLPAASPVEARASFDLLCVDADAFLFDAQALMIRHGVRRLPVRRDGAIVGVLELTDLLGATANPATLVATRIARATAVDDLAEAARGLDPLLRDLHAAGIRVRSIAELVSDLSRKLQRRLFTLLAPADLAARGCLMVMGSEGRGEQIAKTDQDNALILPDDLDPKAARALAGRFTEAMLDFGYPRCPGDMMVSNPAWTRTESQFRDALHGWLTRPGEKAFLHLAAFLDGAAVAGDAALLERLRAYLFERLTGHQGFLAHFARPILAFDTPIGLFHQIRVGRGAHKGEIDIKKGGIFPIVHGTHALALEKHIHAANTFQRIDALYEARAFDADFAADLAEALALLMDMRLQARLAAGDAGGVDDYVPADHLSTLRHDALKDSLLIVKRFKDLVSHHFRLGAF